MFISSTARDHVSSTSIPLVYTFGVKRVIHITLINLMLITIQYKEVGNVSQLLLKCINPSIKDLYSSSSDTELPQIICYIVVLLY